MHSFLDTTSKLKKLSGSWKFEFPNITMNVVIKLGNVTLDGKTTILKVSKNKKYPSSQGWMHFQHGTFIFYIKITLDGSHVVRIDKHGKTISGKVGELLILGIQV